MNFQRLLNIYKLQRHSGLGQRLNIHICNRGYATTRTALQLRAAGILQQETAIEIPKSTSLFSTHTKQNYATAKPATQQPRTPNVEILLERLNAQYTLNGWVNHELCLKILNLLEANIETYNQLLSEEQVQFLLSACGSSMPAQKPAERLMIFQRLWNYLERHAQLQPEHFRIKLQVLQHNRASISDFRTLLQELTAQSKDDEVSPPQSAELFAELLELACSSGDMRQVAEILAEMRALNYALTERNFNTLILGNARNHDLKGSQAVLDSMLAAGLPLSLETQTLLIIAHLENNEQQKALSILKDFHHQFKATQILQIMRSALFVSLQPEVIVQLINELPKEFLGGTEVPNSLKNVCIELLHNDKLPVVELIISTLPKPSFNENQDSDTFAVFLLHELFRANVKTEKIIEIAQMLKQSEKNTRALHIAIEIATRRSPPAALPFLEALAKEETLRPHYFWPLMMYNFRRYGESGIMQTLKLMTPYLACDNDTITQYVLPHLTVTLEDPIQTVKMLDEAGVRAAQSLSHVIAHTLMQRQLAEAQQLTELYPNKLQLSDFSVGLRNVSVTVRATKRYHPFAKLLSALAKKSDNPKMDFIGQLLLEMLAPPSRLRTDLWAFKRFVYEMHKFELSISQTAFETISSILSQENTKPEAETNLRECIKTMQQMSNHTLTLSAAAQEQLSGTGGANQSASSFIKHPRDMSLDELECHLIELEAKRLNTRGVLRRLLQLCVRDGRLQRALEIKAKCDELQVQVSAGMMASILDLYIKLKDLPQATESLKQLQTKFPGFQVDEHKIIDYAALLVHEKQLEAGKELLTQRAGTQKVVGGDYVIKNVWNLLTNVAQLAAGQTPTLMAEQNLTRDTFVFLKNLGFCQAHNAVLGPIVREWLLRGDIVAAIAEFRKLASQYRHTPLQFELLSLLVRLCNGHAADAERFHITNEQAQALLKETTETISNVHGVVNMNSALLLAFAESGTDAQLRRLLINPEFRINQELLVKNCDHLGQEGSIQTLLRLARCARGLSHVIDEQNIYNMLLSKFVKTNDYEAAINLYERLESDDDLKISQDFLRSLVKLLKVNNREIPSNIALRAQVI